MVTLDYPQIADYFQYSCKYICKVRNIQEYSFILKNIMRNE